jgi:alanine-synthesizing transaminase
VEKAPVFVMSGLSKVSALPQMKLGWIVSNDESAHRRLELIADTFLSVGTPVQHAAPKLLNLRGKAQDRIRARTRANLDYLRSHLSPDMSLLHVEGGWYAILQVPRVMSEEDWVIGLLRDRGVLVQPGYFYDFESEAYLVVSLLTDHPAFQAGIAQLIAR